MFGHVLWEGLFGKTHNNDNDPAIAEYAFALGQRVGKRCHYTATRLRMMKWMADEDWVPLRAWVLKDLPGEDPLPPLPFREKP